ncbi:preQ(1) synthase [Pseudomonadota bacterium]|nr:preQ(1) synthase [Alphaproteobacteria bacterium]MDC1356864.1 preQ(1) synthase [Pseudomonadota bacterium]
MSKSTKDLNALGYKSKVPEFPDNNILEKVTNPKIGVDYAIRLTCPEFTSICPVTAQPDFAHIVIDYVPNKFIVESKSFKLYLLGYRNHGAFHEDCTISIAQDIVDLLSPKWLRIGGYWYPRGGIPIDIFWQTNEQPKHLFIPIHNVDNYRGRG